MSDWLPPAPRLSNIIAFAEYEPTKYATDFPSKYTCTPPQCLGSVKFSGLQVFTQSLVSSCQQEKLKSTGVGDRAPLIFAFFCNLFLSF